MSYHPVKIDGNFGFGTMSMTWTPKPPPTEQSIASIKHVIDVHGVTFLNGGEFYGPDAANLKLLKEFLSKNSDEYNRNLTVSIKGGVNLAKLLPDGSKESISRSIDNVISYFPSDPTKRPKILFEIARRDFSVPYEETVGYIAEYVKAGKIDGISLSEVGSESIRKAASVFPISCVELELSLLCQDLLHNGVLETLSELQIPIIAYSPLCRGYLTDYCADNADTYLKDIPEGDVRGHIDKFSKENYEHNIKLIKALQVYAKTKKNTSLEALALSWILNLSGAEEYEGIKNVTKIIPIPSGSTTEKIDKNLSNTIKLTVQDMSDISEIVNSIGVKGYRYNEHHEKLNFA